MHHATQQSTPHVQQFSWSVDEHETVSISTFKDRTHLGPDLVLGPLHEVLHDVGAFCERRDYRVRCNPYWTVRNHKKVLVTHEDVVCRYVTDPIPDLGDLAESLGLRRLTADKWTVLAPNGVLHPQFGPAVTAATDGTWVLLLAKPWLPAEWLLVHRTNVIGPVTTTPTALWEWTDAAAPQGSRPPSAAERRAAVLASL